MRGTSDVDELFTASYRRLVVWLAGLRCSIAGHAQAGPGPCSSDGRCEFVECGRQLEHRHGVDCQLVVAMTRSGQKARPRITTLAVRWGPSVRASA